MSAIVDPVRNVIVVDDVRAAASAAPDSRGHVTVLLAPRGKAHEPIAAIAFTLLTAGIPCCIVTTRPPGGLAECAAVLGAATSAWTVIGRVADADGVLGGIGEDGMGYRTGGTRDDRAWIASGTDEGRRLHAVLERCRRDTVHGIVVAGLRIHSDVSRPHSFMTKLVESGAVVTRDGEAARTDTDFIVTRDVSSLDAQEPAIAINVAGPDEPATAAWIQTVTLPAERLPVVAAACVAVASTPLNQWRRWML